MLRIVLTSLVMILVLPWYPVYHLQMSLRHRLTVCGMFLWGCFVVAVGITRVVFVSQNVKGEKNTTCWCSFPETISTPFLTSTFQISKRLPSPGLLFRHAVGLSAPVYQQCGLFLAADTMTVFPSSCDLSTQDQCHGRRDLRLAITSYLRPIMMTSVTASRKRLWCAELKLPGQGSMTRLSKRWEYMICQEWRMGSWFNPVSVITTVFPRFSFK